MTELDQPGRTAGLVQIGRKKHNVDLHIRERMASHPGVAAQNRATPRPVPPARPVPTRPGRTGAALARIFIAGLIALLLGESVRVEAVEAVEINDHGQPRHFEVATDELQVATRTGQRRSQHVRGLATVAQIRLHAELEARASGDEIDLVLYELGRAHDRFSRRILTKQLLIRLQPGLDARTLAQQHGLEWPGEIPYAPDHFVLTVPQAGATLALAEALRRYPGVVSAEPLLAVEHSPRIIPNDPLFGNEWHLLNTGQSGGTIGADINVVSVWNTYRGAGVVIGVVDGAVAYTHPDLAPNYDTTIDYDFNGNGGLGDNDPAPDGLPYAFHGTGVAGLVAARGNNGVGIAGVAYEATVTGLRLIATPHTDAMEAAATAHRNDVISVKNNSWGPSDDGRTLQGPGPLTLAALADGVQNGRGGKGTIYVWAGGNGGDLFDDQNYDGYVNSIYTISVGACDHNGAQSYYSEPGACMIVIAPGGPVTTDDVTGYQSDYDGTSASSPLVAGVTALMLEANPNLGWRDVQAILLRSAAKNQPTDSDWITNSAGLYFNHKFGAGLLDASAAVTLATTWTNLGTQQNLVSAQPGLALTIPDNNATGLTRTFDLSSSSVLVEHVTVTVHITHGYRGQLTVTLTSPSGTQSRLAEVHNDPGASYNNWKFMSVRNWGEHSQGIWTVQIADRTPGVVGTLDSIRLDVFGTTVANQPPTLSAPADQSIHADGALTALPFTVGDLETPAADLVVTGTSSDQTLLPNANLGFGGGGSNRTLTVTPAAGQTGTATITLTVTDGNGATTNGTLLVHVTHLPTLALPGGPLAYTEGSGPVIVDGTALVTDPDSAGFNGGNLTVTFTAGGAAEDRLRLVHEGNGAGQVGLVSGLVSYGASSIGLVSGGSSGSDPLVVTFYSTATVPAVEAVVRRVAYQNVASVLNLAPRTLRFTVTDANQGASPAATQTVNLTAIPNDPTITWPAPVGIVYGTTLGGTQLNASANTAGTFSYTPATGALLNAGDGQTLTVVFTPTDTANFNSATQTVTIDVAKVALTLAVEDKARTYGAADPTFTAQYTGFVNSEDQSVFITAPTFGTTAGPTSPAGNYAINATGTSAANYTITTQAGVLTLQAALSNRLVFYNNSKFDGPNPAANAADDGAIATNKTALLPGGTATFANYTSYSRGLNGVMVDIGGLPGTPTAADFTFKSGNSSSPAGWTNAPAPTSVTIRPGAGTGGTDRVTLIWADNAIQKEWLQVTVLASAVTGLPAAEVFYFGNAVGDTGNSATDAQVNSTDIIGARNNPRGFTNLAPIDNPYDFNRDRLVNSTDIIIARNNPTGPLSALRLITVP